MFSKSASPGTMTEAIISDICKKKGGYRTPELNEHLYLHFQAFTKIFGLREYVSCRVLWLENNLIEHIEGLETLTLLHSLYLQHNCISTLAQTPHYPSIRAINLSHNKITTLEGIDSLPNLEKLLASNNQIVDCTPVAALVSLQVLDLSHNQIGDAVATRETVSKCPALASLMLHGNLDLNAVKNFRKTLIFENKNLKYLDEYPVFDDERRRAVAFIEGGWEKEREEKEKIHDEEVARQHAQRAFFQRVLDNARAKRASSTEATDNAQQTSSTPYFEQMRDDEEQRETHRVVRKPTHHRKESTTTTTTQLVDRSNDVDADDDDIIFVPSVKVESSLPSESNAQQRDPSPQHLSNTDRPIPFSQLRSRDSAKRTLHVDCSVVESTTEEVDAGVAAVELTTAPASPNVKNEDESDTKVEESDDAITDAAVIDLSMAECITIDSAVKELLVKYFSGAQPEEEKEVDSQ